MDFEAVLAALLDAFRKDGIECALIGGFALAALGAPRATGDLDFLLPGARSVDVDRIMRQLGYEALYRSENVANYTAREQRLGSVDFVFARRPYSQGMLARATPHRVLGSATVKVVQAEDLIGLKIQSSSNDPERLLLDLADIDRLIAAAGPALDLDRVREYFRLFDREAELDAILARHRSR